MKINKKGAYYIPDMEVAKIKILMHLAHQNDVEEEEFTQGNKSHYGEKCACHLHNKNIITIHVNKKISILCS